MQYSYFLLGKTTLQVHQLKTDFYPTWDLKMQIKQLQLLLLHWWYKIKFEMQVDREWTCIGNGKLINTMLIRN